MWNVAECMNLSVYHHELRDECKNTHPDELRDKFVNVRPRDAFRYHTKREIIPDFVWHSERIDSLQLSHPDLLVHAPPALVLSIPDAEPFGGDGTAGGHDATGYCTVGGRRLRDVGCGGDRTLVAVTLDGQVYMGDVQ